MKAAATLGIVDLAALAAAAWLSACASAPTTAPRLRPEDLPDDRRALVEMADGLDAGARSAADFADELIVIERAEKLGAPEDDIGWRVARALSGLADLAATREERAARARRAVERAERAIRRLPARVEPRYYHALGLAMLARAELTASLDLVPRIEAAAKEAAARDERFEHGGPLRFLGMLYLRAPAWPLSIGDPDASVLLLERAVELAPEFPLNHLFLGQAYQAQGRYADAEGEARRALGGMGEPRWAAVAARWRQEAEDTLQLARELASGAQR